LRACVALHATSNHTTHTTPQPTAQWFEELGGFEEAANIPIFVGWALKAVELFGARITYWATFNEPTVSDTQQSSAGLGAGRATDSV
jgi:beta-glucosidase/6-phospho-beta-glucosidase/beta-galactosidase